MHDSTPAMSAFLSSCPGLPGDLARYIYDSSEADQPGIALAASFAFLSALYSGRVYYKEGSRITEPPLFIVAIAGTGTGKTSAMNSIRILLEAANLTHILLGTPASEPGLVKALEQNPRRFWMWDEMGFAIAALSKSQNAYESQIISTAIKLYSESGKSYLGKEYAKQERIDIKAPYLSVFGASTPSKFYAALDRSFVDSGFLPRFLCFFAEPRKQKFAKPVSSERVRSLVKQIKEIEAWTSPDGNLQKVSTIKTKSQIKIVGSTDDLPGFEPTNPLTTFDSFKADINAITFDGSTSDSIEVSFYSRAIENCIKLCLAFGHPTPEAVDWCIKLTHYLLKTTCLEVRQNVLIDNTTRIKAEFDNDLSSRIRDLLNVGERGSKTWLWRKIRSWQGDRRAKQSAISDLIDAGIFCETQEDTGSPRKTTFYTREV